jgi:hypothetical protein
MTVTRPRRSRGNKAKTFMKRHFHRFRTYVRQVPWDDAIPAQEEWIEEMYIGVIIVASLYFIPPALIMLFLG